MFVTRFDPGADVGTFISGLQGKGKPAVYTVGNLIGVDLDDFLGVEEHLLQP